MTTPGDPTGTSDGEGIGVENDADPTARRVEEQLGPKADPETGTAPGAPADPEHQDKDTGQPS